MRSIPAALLGFACIIGTLIILFGHIRTIDELTVNHLYILLALIVTLGAGHYMWDSFGEGVVGFARGLSLTVLFVVGTVVCVGLSGGRSAAILEAKERAARDADTARIKQEEVVAAANAAMIQAQSILDAANATATKDEDIARTECASGKGTQCEGKRLTATTSRTNATTAKNDLDTAKTYHRDQLMKLNSMHTPEPPNAELKNFAKLWAFFSSKPLDTAMADVKLLFPYMLALLTEFGTIVFLNLGFSHKRPQQQQQPQQPTDHITLATIATELNIKPHIARRMVRDLQITRPAQGWVWPAPEAIAVKQKLLASRAQGATN